MSEYFVSLLETNVCLFLMQIPSSKKRYMIAFPWTKGVESGGGDGLHVNPERSFGGTNGEPPSEASQLRKGGPGVLPRKI